MILGAGEILAIPFTGVTMYSRSAFVKILHEPSVRPPAGCRVRETNEIDPDPYAIRIDPERNP